jgi:2-dehydro-3-deoxyphosphogluconate aldolase/(4S)-4-hydroxy-2-oxoglutarate aldolase
MRNVFEQLELLGIVPVIVIDDAADAVPLARALAEGGLPCAEVTFRTAAARESIAAISKAMPEMLVGAGTVLTTEQVQAAVESGAKFIVAPGLNPKVVEYCLSRSIPMTPGVATPSDVERAMELGLTVVKFFPAEASGGVNYLKAMSAPYKGMRFIPTGGVDETNVLSYLRLPSVLACGGSWMVKNELIAPKQFEEITRRTKRAVQTMLGFHLAHVGINLANEEEAETVAHKFGALLDVEVKEGTSSIFAGKAVELLKSPSFGEHGHIAIGTNFIRRAVAYLERNGYVFRGDSKREKDGKLVAIDLQEEIGGFAVHLLQV